MNIRYLEEFSFGANAAKELIEAMLRQYRMSLIDMFEDAENERPGPTRTTDRIRGEIHATDKAIAAIVKIDIDPACQGAQYRKDS